VYAVNVEGVQHLADLCQQLDILLVQLSTDYVFAGDALAAYHETDATQPLSAYGRSKLLAEQVVAKNSRYLIVRSSWVFSHYGHNFVKTILKVAAERDRLSVVDDQVGSPTSALELAKAILQLADKVIADLALSGCYHYSGATSLSWYEFACRITVIAAQQGVLGNVPSIQPISSDEYPSKAIRPAFSTLNCSKIKALGISTLELDTALEKVIRLLAH
jgi:dTDP-4-dehydrorhamnose reductase